MRSSRAAAAPGPARGAAGALVAAALVAGALLVAPLLPGAVAPARAAGPPVAIADAFRVTAPRAPWTRAADLDPPGRLTWTIDDPRATTAQLRVEYVGVHAADPAAARAELLGRERAEVVERAAQRKEVERGEFEPDSTAGGRLDWRGFHVHLRVGDRSGEIWRWVALAPDFPRRHRGYLVALDEQTLADARGVPRVADARAVLGSLEPTGRGLAGGLADAYLEARVAAFSARIDSTTRLCWRALDDEPGHGWIGVARGLAGEGDFFQRTNSLPRDSVVDAASADYGVGFDRNGDGKIDLAVLNRGVVSARGAVMLPVVVVLADDDFDGRVDGCVMETGDADGDGRADHRICVLDTNHDGRADRAFRFVDGLTDPANRPLKIDGGVVLDTTVGSRIGRLDFAQSWREGDALLARWNRLLQACGR